ncbi:MAG: adenosylmethionine--8-amino-7-oxononanoate transaminase [Gammaproteobacteria bacterium]
MVEKSIIDIDLKHIWHPCSQMKDYETFKPLVVQNAKGSEIFLKNGQPIIDAIASWWCKSLGHHHPRLKHALLKQAEHFEHVILANTTNETITKLSQRLASLTKTLDKISFASDGSCAIEMALKMSIHSRKILNQQHKKAFLSLQNSYHGETIGTLAVSDLGIYKAPYQSLYFKDVQFVKNIPYVSGKEDPLWSDCSEIWPTIEKQLAPFSDATTALIVEPIIQGAGGMKIYSQDFLKRLRCWTEQHDIHLITDEILTGMGRTGTMLACEHANIEPDFLCLSKGLTAGYLPLSVMLTNKNIYNYFYHDYDPAKSFLHSHTHSGNALAAACALEVFKIIDDENILDRAQELENKMKRAFTNIANKTRKLKNIRGIGGMVAADLITDHPNRRIGYEIFQKAVEYGALLRPLGNTVYWLPPLNIDDKTLIRLEDITVKAINAIDF